MRRDALTGCVTTLAVFAVYGATSAPGIGLVDSGELTAVAATLSIAHPTGYPLYTLLGRLWLLFSGLEAARGMVLFSCAASAAAAGVLAFAAVRWFRAVRDDKTAISALAAGVTALGFALTPTAWTAVSYAEVYPLTFLLAALILVVAVQSINFGDPRLTIVACYLWGLGFGNHLTIIWFAPVIAYAVVRSVRASGNPRKIFLLTLGAWALGASVILFLPLRSHVDPRLDWGDPQSLQNLIRHLSAWQYRVWMFKGDWTQFLHKLGSYITSLPADLGWAVTAAALIGVTLAVRRRMWSLLVIFSVWVLGVAYNLNYDIPDIATYFLALYSPLFLLAAWGMAQTARWIGARWRGNCAPAVALSGMALAVVVLSVPAALPEANRSGDRFAEGFSKEVLSTLPDSALVLQANWDIQSSVTCLQIVQGVRTDVVMLDVNLLQRSWYVRQERRAHPEVFAGLDGEIESFLKEVAIFESGRPFDSQRIESAYLGMANGIISRNMSHRPVYVRDMQAYRHPGIAASFRKSPGAFFLRIGEPSRSEPILNADNLLSGRRRFEPCESVLLREAGMSAALQGSRAIAANDSARVLATLKAALKLAPYDPLVRQFEAAAREWQHPVSSENP